MPRISKVRIVNFSFNDGNRMIADELFDFQSADNQDGQNVLINLANGGGKSVLVQLMMQPIIPRAKVAGRKIESHFTRVRDHCFVLLEWVKDNSDEKLLTGIAMAAMEKTTSEESEERGMSVKYYTFYTNYLADDAPYSIAQLPLSEQENRRFIPADYIFVKNLAKKSSGQLVCYPSDEGTQWRKKLEEYGLIQNEWHMIEKLNAQEGGFGEFFGGFKTSDALIDGLLIPTIEQKIRPANRTEDTALTTIFLNYVKQYESHQTILQRKSVLEEFHVELEQFLPLAEALWKENNEKSKRIGELFGLYDALKRKESELQTVQAQIQDAYAAADKKENRIHWEERSARYYEIEDQYNRVASETEQLKDQYDKLTKELEALKDQIKIQECAKYAEKLLEEQSKRAGIQAEIDSQEQGSDSAMQLKSLKYSAARAIQGEREQLDSQYDALQDRNRELDARIAQQQAVVSDAEQKQKRAERDYQQLVGRFQSMQEETDRQVCRIAPDLPRRLSGEYGQDDLQEIRKDTLKGKEAAQNQQTRVKAEQETLTEKLNAIPDQIVEIQTAISTENTACSGLRRELEVYQSEKAGMEQICRQYGLSFEQCFNGGAVDYLQTEQQNIQADRGNLLRRLAIVEEEIEAAGRGAVHVPHGVIEYLNGTGVTYNTCEKYLLEQVEEGKLERENCLEILHRYPAVAYGILMEQTSLDRVLDREQDQWLPAMVPIFTQEQMAQILTGRPMFTGALAFYSEDYFADPGHYLENRKQMKQELLDRQEQLEQRAQELGDQLLQAKSFRYSETWESEMLEQLRRAKRTVEDCMDKLGQLKAEQTELRQQQDRLSDELETLRVKLSKYDGTLSLLQDIFQRLDQEAALLRDCDGAKSQRDDLERQLRTEEERLEEWKARQRELSRRSDQLEEQLDKLRTAWNEVSDAEETQLIPGEWEQLLASYRQMQSSIGAELNRLREERQAIDDRCAEYQKEIQKRDLSEETYGDVQYSESLLEQMEADYKNTERVYEPAKEKYADARLAKERLGTKLEDAESEARPYGGLLDRAEVGENFKARLKQLQEERQKFRQREMLCSEENKRLNRNNAGVQAVLERLERPEKVAAVALLTDYVEQSNDGKKALTGAEKSCEAALDEVQKQLEIMAKRFGEPACVAAPAVTTLWNILNQKKPGDTYYTLWNSADDFKENTLRAIGAIETTLKEFTNSRNDLVRQCTLQGRRIYDGLRQIENSSRVAIYAGKEKKKMIRFDIPDQVDEVRARIAVQKEIDQGVHEILMMKQEDAAAEAAVNKAVRRVVGSRTLLRRYIGQDMIRVEAFKIDQNARNAGYRTWEATQINNSGAEKFVVYFFIILSLMNYARGAMGGIQDKELHSTLILDNPFGATSSRHILQPMFNIAKNFRVQMICLSDINKADVVSCFEVVIKAIVKQMPASSRELLTHDSNENIEHGFYRAEQLSLF